MPAVDTAPTMQITVSRDALAAGVARAVRAVDRRNTIPILAHVLLVAGADGLRLRATDLDIEIACRIEADIAAAGAVTLPAHTLNDIIRKQPEGSQVRIEAADKGTAIIRAGRARFSLQTLEPNDFPSLSGPEAEYAFALPAEALAAALKRVEFAISSEETRYYLNGIHLHRMDGEAGPVLCLVATDGHRLSLAELPAPEGSEALAAGIIIPRKAVGEIQRIAEGTGEVAFAGNHSSLAAERGGAAGSIRLVTKLIDGTFPDYRRVVPAGNPLAAVLDAAEFAAAVDRVSVVASERGRAVKFALGEGAVRLTVVNPDSGEATDEVEAAYGGAPIEIGFNARYVLDVLASFGGKGRIELRLADPASPALVRAMAGDTPATDALCVLMPMRV